MEHCLAAWLRQVAAGCKSVTQVRLFCGRGFPAPRTPAPTHSQPHLRHSLAVSFLWAGLSSPANPNPLPTTTSATASRSRSHLVFRCLRKRKTSTQRRQAKRKAPCFAPFAFSLRLCVELFCFSKPRRNRRISNSEYRMSKDGEKELSTDFTDYTDWRNHSAYDSVANGSVVFFWERRRLNEESRKAGKESFRSCFPAFLIQISAGSLMSALWAGAPTPACS